MQLLDALAWSLQHPKILLVLCVILPVMSGAAVWVWITRRNASHLFRFFAEYPGAIIVFDRNESVLYMNQAANPDGKTVVSMAEFAGVDYELYSQKIAEVFLSGSANYFMYEIDNVPHRVLVTPIKSASFGSRAVVAFINKNAELLDVKRESEDNAAKLKRANHIWNIVINALPLHVFVKNPQLDYRYEYTNAAMQKFFGIDEETFRGKNDFELFTRDIAERYHAEDEKNIQEMKFGLKSIEPIKMKDGKTRYYCLTRWPFTDENGQKMMLGVAADVTELEEPKQIAEKSRHLLDELLRNIPVGVAALEPDTFRFVLCNQAFADMEGRTPDELVGRRIDELNLTAFDLQQVQKEDKQIKEGQGWIETISSARGPDGSERSYRVVKFMLNPDSAGRLIVGVFSDVTELASNAAKLRKQQELLEIIINSIPVMIFAKEVNDDFRYTLANRYFEQFMGWRAEEIVGRTDYNLFKNGDVADYFRHCDEQIFLSGEAKEYNENPIDANGRLRHLRTTKMLYTDAEGKQLLLGVSVDVTELNHMISNAEAVNLALSKVTLADSFDASVGDVSTALRRILRCDRVMLTRCNDQGLLRLNREWKSDNDVSLRDASLEMHYKLWDAHIEDMRSDKVLAFPDLKQAPDVALQIKKGMPLTQRSLIVAPIFVHGKLWGALFATFLQKHSLGDHEKKLMRSMCNIIALAVIREHQNFALQQANNARQTILDNIGIPVWLYDGDGNLSQMNRSARSLAGGMTVDEVKRKGCYEVFHCNLNSPDKCPVQLAIADGKPHRDRYYNNGREYLFESRPVLSDDGKVLNVVQSAVDVTELNVMISGQRALAGCLETLIRENNVSIATDEALALFCRHVGASRCAVFRLDGVMRFASCSAEYSIDGSEPAFESGRDYPFSTHPNWLERFKQTEQYVFTDPQNSPDGLGGDWRRVIAAHDIASLCVNRIMIDGRVWGYVALIYEHKKHEFDSLTLDFVHSFAHFIELLLEKSESQTRIMQALEQARAADKAKSFFIASVSHEIRTPLNAVIGFAELLRDGSFSQKESKEYLNSIAYSGNALLQLINDVLDLSKLEAGQMHIMPEPVDFVALAQESIKVFSYNSSQRGIALKVDIGDLPELELDKLRIRQIIFNLLGNAVKFTDHGSVTLSASFEPTDVTSGEFTFAVTDTGIGISEKDQTKLMEPFVQLSRLRGTNASGNGGTGLGLSISRRLVEKMGGCITIDSAPGRGSTFRIRIPGVGFHAVSKRPRSTVDTNITAVTAITSLLIVDDVEMNLKVMRTMCKKAGVEDVVTVTSAKEALAALEKRVFSVVLTDMWMPGIDGAELARRIRADRRFDAIPVVAVTADAEAAENFDVDKFFGILLKPVTIEKLQNIFCQVQDPVGKA